MSEEGLADIPDDALIAEAVARDLLADDGDDDCEIGVFGPPPVLFADWLRDVKRAIDRGDAFEVRVLLDSASRDWGNGS